MTGDGIFTKKKLITVDGKTDKNNLIIDLHEVKNVRIRLQAINCIGYEQTA